MHGIANPKNREFKSHPLLQVKSIQPLDGLVPGQFFTALAQLDRALDYESGGWEFESLRWYHLLYGVCRQVVKASGCDSDMRGFDPHQTPQFRLCDVDGCVPPS